MYKCNLNARGQIVIPAEMRKKMSLVPGMSFLLYEQSGKIVLAQETEDPVGRGLGILKGDGPSDDVGEKRV